MGQKSVDQLSVDFDVELWIGDIVSPSVNSLGCGDISISRVFVDGSIIGVIIGNGYFGSGGGVTGNDGVTVAGRVTGNGIIDGDLF